MVLLFVWAYARRWQSYYIYVRRECRTFQNSKLRATKNKVFFSFKARTIAILILVYNFHPIESKSSAWLSNKLSLANTFTFLNYYNKNSITKSNMLHLLQYTFKHFRIILMWQYPLTALKSEIVSVQPAVSLITPQKSLYYIQYDRKTSDIHPFAFTQVRVFTEMRSKRSVGNKFTGTTKVRELERSANKWGHSTRVDSTQWSRKMAQLISICLVS